AGQPFIVNDNISLIIGSGNGIFGFGPGTTCAGSPAPVNGIAFGPVCITVGAAGGTLTANQPISAGASNILLVAGNITLARNGRTGAGNAVTLAPFSLGVAVSLDPIKVVGALSLTQADMSFVQSPVLQIGLPGAVVPPLAGTSGNISINTAITQAGTGWTTLS